MKSSLQKIRRKIPFETTQSRRHSHQSKESDPKSLQPIHFYSFVINGQLHGGVFFAYSDDLGHLIRGKAARCRSEATAGMKLVP